MTVSAGAAFDYAATADVPLAIGGGLTVSGGAGTVIGGAVGSTTTSSEINVTGEANATGNVKVNVYGINGVVPAGGTNTYTLLRGNALSATDGATYTLGMVYNNSNFTVGALSYMLNGSDPGNVVTIPVTSRTALTTAFWQGGLSGATQVWAASNGTSQSNWVASYGGAAQPLAPAPRPA